MLTPATAFFKYCHLFLDVCLTNWLSKNEQFLLKPGSNGEHNTSESVMSECYKQITVMSYKFFVRGFKSLGVGFEYLFWLGPIV